VVASVGVAMDWAVTCAVGFFLLLANAGPCFTPSTAAHLQAAQRGFLTLLAVLAIPWLVAGLCSRHRRRVAGFAIAGLALAIVFALQTLGSTPDELTTSVCVY